MAKPGHTGNQLEEENTAAEDRAGEEKGGHRRI
jgi:hypothetical protein